MTVLAQTTEYLVEFESRMLSIARFSDGHVIGLVGKRLSGDFKSCVKSHGAERAIGTYLRLSAALLSR